MSTLPPDRARGRSGRVEASSARAAARRRPRVEVAVLALQHEDGGGTVRIAILGPQWAGGTVTGAWAARPAG